MAPSNQIKVLKPGAREPQASPNPHGHQRFVPPTPKPSSRRLHRKQAAEYLGLSLSWLDKSRLTGLGPVFTAISGRVVYDLRDLDQFLLDHRRLSTSE